MAEELGDVLLMSRAAISEAVLGTKFATATAVQVGVATLPDAPEIIDGRLASALPPYVPTRYCARRPFCIMLRKAGPAPARIAPTRALQVKPDGRVGAV